MLVLARYDDIVLRFGVEVAAFAPIYRHILDELEGIHMLGIVLRCVAGHLQRGVHRDIERELAGDGGAYGRAVAAPGFQVSLEDAGGIVHRTAVQAGERKHCGMAGLNASEGLVFGTHCGFVGDEVRVGPAQTGRAHGFVGIDHNVMLCGLGDAVLVVVDHILAVMMHAFRQNVAYISGLDGIVAVLLHKIVGSFQMTLVVARAGRGLVVHY